MKRMTGFLLAALLLFTACGAGVKTPSAAQPQGRSVTFQDDTGNTVTVQTFQTVAALSGSFADLWMLAGGTVQCTTQDAFEERDLGLPENVVNAGSLKEPSAEILLEAGVDFVLLSAAVPGQLALRETLENAGVTTACFTVETFEDYMRMLKICTDITGRSDCYEENGIAVQRQVEDVKRASSGKQAPDVLLIRAYSTGAKVKNSDNMTGAMLADLGCNNIADSDASLLEDLSMEKIIAADPDFIFVTTMGSDDEALAALAENLQSNPAWAQLTAVKEGRYVVLPKNLFHYKPNARWGESYAMLADILYGA